MFLLHESKVEFNGSLLVCCFAVGEEEDDSASWDDAEGGTFAGQIIEAARSIATAMNRFICFTDFNGEEIRGGAAAAAAAAAAAFVVVESTSGDLGIPSGSSASATFGRSTVSDGF